MIITIDAEKSILQNAIFYDENSQQNGCRRNAPPLNTGHIRTPVQHSDHESPGQTLAQGKEVGTAEAQLPLCVKAMVLHRTLKILEVGAQDIDLRVFIISDSSI